MNDTADSGLSLLSPREREVLSLASQGLTDKQIALRIGVSLTTVRTHWERLRNKTETVNRAQAVATFVRGVAGEPEVEETPAEPSTLLQAAIDTVLGGIVVLDENLRILAANEKLHSIANRPIGALVGKHLEVLFDRRYETFKSLKANIGLRESQSDMTLSGFMRVSSGPDLLVNIGVRFLETGTGLCTVLAIHKQVEDLDARRRGLRAGDN